MPKNILFLMTDEHRWDSMGYMDHPVLGTCTPNFDRLALEGAVFTHCYSPNPLCMPARNAIHAGLYTFQTGQMDNVGDWPMCFPTFTQALQKLGYRTALTGKIHAHECVGQDMDLTDKVWDDEVRALGFDDVVQTAGKTMAYNVQDSYTHYLQDHGLLYAYLEDIVERDEAARAGRKPWWPSILADEHYIDNYIGRKAVEWFESYDDDRPFFHMVSFCSPHTCFDAYQRALDDINFEQVRPPVANDNPEFYRDMRANYAAMIHIVDENVGRILEVLESRGWLEDTLIVFTADHGAMLGDLGKHSKTYWEDGSVRVPMLVRYKPWTGQRIVSDALVSCHDVPATILDFAAGEDRSQEYLPGCTSVSLRPFLTGAVDRVREAVYSENGGQFSRPWRMVDNGSHRYVWFTDTGEELLFDRRSDPHCLRNTASQPGMESVVDQMRRHLLDIHLSNPTPKTGRAGYSPHAPHTCDPARLLKFKPK